jgi:hypothetical protein
MENIDKKAHLDKATLHFVQQGFRIISQTENSVQLIKPKQFSNAAFILIFFYILPFIIYLLYYALLKKDESLYIVINEQGRLSITNALGITKMVDNIESFDLYEMKNIETFEDYGDIDGDIDPLYLATIAGQPIDKERHSSRNSK